MVATGEALLEQPDELLRIYEQTGDERAFSQLVENYRGMVFAVCVRVMRNTHDAEDATQAVFLTLAMQARSGNNIRMLTPWLQQVAQRVSLDMYKSRKRRTAREDIRRQQTREHFDADEGLRLDRDELRQTLRLQLNELPAKYRLPMILYYFGGLTPEAIARELGCKKKTLGVRLFRARKMLAEQLASRGVLACGAPLLLALREVMQQGLLQSLPAPGAQYIGAGASAGLGFDHLSSTVSAMASALARFAGGSKLRLALLLVIAAGSGVAGSAGLIRDFTRVIPLKLLDPRFDAVDDFLQSIPRLFSPQLLTVATEDTAGGRAASAPARSSPVASYPIVVDVPHPILAPATPQLAQPAISTSPPPPSSPPAKASLSARRETLQVRLAPPVEHKIAPIALSLDSGHSTRMRTALPASSVEELTSRDAGEQKSGTLEFACGDSDSVNDLLAYDGGGVLFTTNSSVAHLIWNVDSLATGAGRSSFLLSEQLLYSDGVVTPGLWPSTPQALPITQIPEPDAVSLMATAVMLMQRRRRSSDNSVSSD